ncbi:hypothetical protein [Nocardia carnea]|uniref:hypothetical protein n=1 Tax=Nocardia carnea TaxID=37328 RepID=UPI002456B16D|nr:hypothetical protein [Nocardia carnea]
MTGTDYRQPEGIAEFADELRLLAEAVLERVEPVLREAAADGEPEWANCTWCPLCAAAALIRGEHHEVLATVAAHGTAIVTVLREALAGAPVEPVLPHDHGTKPPAAQSDSGETRHTAAPGDSAGSGTTRPGGETGGAAGDQSPPGRPDDTTGAGARAAGAGKSRYVGIPVTIKP